MRQALLSYDPITRKRQVFHASRDGNEYGIETVYDVEPIMDAAKGEHAMIDERARWGDIERVASIPMPLYFELQEKGIVQDQKAFRRWLNDRDNSVFRTRPGRV